MAHPRRSVYLVVENHSLAKPLIAALGLKRTEEFEKLRCFVSETILLAESRAEASGVGATTAAAVTVSYLLGRGGFDASTRIVHVGECRPASSAGQEPREGLVLANRVHDASSGRTYYPDILVAHELNEVGIETQAVARRRRAAAFPLVDRELSGFLAAALTFLAPHQVYCLAAVTGSTGPQAGRGAAIISDAMGPALRLLDESGKLLRPAVTKLDEDGERTVATIARELRLTAAQTAQLSMLVEAAAERGRDVATLLEAVRGRTVRTKQERNQLFAGLKRAFDE